MKNSPLQQHLLNLLSFEGAHAGFDDAVRGLAPELRGKKIKGAPHTAWQLLEHMRIAQWDILEFSRDAKHVSPKWPEGYWPESASPPSDAAWKKLSPEVQKAMIDVADELIPSACRQVQNADEETKKSLESAIRFETLQAGAGAKFKDLLNGVAKTWSEGLDARGKRGSDALKEFEAAVASTPAK